MKTVAIYLILLIGSSVVTVEIYSRYVPALRRAKDVALQQNLWTMRRSIDFYWQDRERPPQSLDELISAGYLREIPIDPVTKSNQTWIIEREKEYSVPNAQPGIIDVRSGAAGADKNGKPY